jgi:hypothetical protein
LNYCKNCRRHLNGAVSCPGCGATGFELSNVQDGRSTLRMPSIGDDEQSVTSHGRLPVPEAEPYEGDLVTGPQEGVGRARHPDLPRPSVVSDADSTREMSPPKSAGGGRRGISVGDDGDDNDNRDSGRRPRAERRGEKRHGIGLMLTGGFAGIIVVAFLLYGNAGGGSDGAPAGNVVAAGPTGSSTVSTASLTETASATGPASSAVATSASASPTHTASASPSKSSTPEQATTSAAPGRSATATATRTTASAPPTSASPTAKPSPSSTKSSCFLIFCT